MIREALEFLRERFEAAGGVRDLGPTEDDRNRRYQVGGQIQTVDIPPNPRNHLVYCLDDLISFVEHHADPEGHITPAIWHHTDRVVAILDDDDRRERCGFPLEFSEPFQRLRELDVGAHKFRQREFVRFLDLILGVEKALVARFRRLDWRTQIAATGEVAPGRDRLGKEVNATVAGTAELPDDLLVNVPVYREKGETDPRVVRCRIETYPTDEVLTLRPVPGEIDAALDAAQMSIRQHLVEALGPDARIYYGSPE